MSEYIVRMPPSMPYEIRAELNAWYVESEPIVRCRDCKHLDIPDWDNTLAENYGEPPTFCMLLSMNEWRMDGNRRVADTTFLEVEPNTFCAWAERKDA